MTKYEYFKNELKEKQSLSYKLGDYKEVIRLFSLRHILAVENLSGDELEKELYDIEERIFEWMKNVMLDEPLFSGFSPSIGKEPVQNLSISESILSYFYNKEPTIKPVNFKDSDDSKIFNQIKGMDKLQIIKELRKINNTVLTTTEDKELEIFKAYVSRYFFLRYSENIDVVTETEAVLKLDLESAKKNLTKTFNDDDEMTLKSTMKKIGENKISTKDISDTVEEMKINVLEKYMEQSDEDADSLVSNLTSKNKQGVEKTLLEFRKRNMYLSRETKDEPTPLSSPMENLNRILIIVVAGLLLTLSLTGYKYETEQVADSSAIQNTLSQQILEAENNLEQLEGGEWITETMKSMAEYTYNYMWSEEDMSKPETQTIQTEDIINMEEEIDRNIIFQLLPIIKDIWVTIIPINMLLITLTKINGDNKISGWIIGFFRLLQLFCLLLIFYGSKCVYSDGEIDETAGYFSTMASYVGLPTFLPSLTSIFSSIPRYVYSLMSNSGIYNNDIVILVTSAFQFCHSSYEQYIDYNLFLIKQKEMMIKLRLDMGEFSFNIDEFKKETKDRIDSDIDQGGGLPTILQERKRLLNIQYTSINQATANMNAQINQLASLTDISIKEKNLAIQERLATATENLNIQEDILTKRYEKESTNDVLLDSKTGDLNLPSAPLTPPGLISTKVDLTVSKYNVSDVEITFGDLEQRMKRLRESSEKPNPKLIAASPPNNNSY